MISSLFQNFDRFTPRIRHFREKIPDQKLWSFGVFLNIKGTVIDPDITGNMLHGLRLSENVKKETGKLRGRSGEKFLFDLQTVRSCHIPREKIRFFKNISRFQRGLITDADIKRIFIHRGLARFTPVFHGIDIQRSEIDGIILRGQIFEPELNAVGTRIAGLMVKAVSSGKKYMIHPAGDRPAADQLIPPPACSAAIPLAVPGFDHCTVCFRGISENPALCQGLPAAFRSSCFYKIVCQFLLASISYIPCDPLERYGRHWYFRQSAGKYS